MSLENSPSFLLNFSEDEMYGGEKHFYQFKSFRLDVEERQLLHSGDAISLTPKAFDVLAALVKRGGHLVEKDELLKLVWADSFVEEANVARIVHMLRKVLGEDDNGNKYIETVAKKGYRFVAEVEKVREVARDSATGNQIPSTAVEKLAEFNIQIPPSETDKIDVPIVSKPKGTTRIILAVIGILSVISLISLLAFNR